jgi:4-hydroxy-4-methyl-2-oxoglutarate aldolase
MLRMTDKEMGGRLRACGTSALSDALDKLGIDGQIPHIRPVVRSMGFAGPAFTVEMLPVGQTGGSVGDYIDDVSAGDVVVIANDGRMDATVWGDILTSVASARGVAGTVIDGVCRDSDRCVELDYAVFARASWMRTGKDRVTAHAYNVPVNMAGIRISPGDWLVGDADGVVSIPQDRVAETLAIAEAIEVTEAKICAAVATGRRLDDVRAELGYHALQTRSDPS